jgi:uncharacterized protein YacL
MLPHFSTIRSCWLDLPEWNIAIFSFLLNFVWEVQQMPFFQVSPEFSYLNLITNCTLATVGDVGISLVAFWTVAAISRSRQWFRQPRRSQIIGFILVGLVITIIFEALATGILRMWQYAALMPILPFLGTGLLPFLQWLLLPLLILWFLKRQLSSTRQEGSRYP